MNAPKHVVPSNKFLAPKLNTANLLSRTQLIVNKLPTDITQTQHIIIEAQAGQGKSTLAAQFISSHNHSALWYQVDDEDNDPVYLLYSLYGCFLYTFPTFSSSSFEAILKEGNIGPLDLNRCANILLNDVRQFLSCDTILVFEDLHLIANSHLTNELLRHILETSPDNLKFLITTRTSLSVTSRLLYKNSTTYLCTNDLALEKDDTEKLLTTILHQDVSPADILQIQQVTKGWVMGILLATHPMGHQSLGNGLNASPISFVNIHSHAQLLSYFQDEIFSFIPANLHSSFLKLSFMEEIPTELAIKVTGNPDIPYLLTGMVKDNSFITALPSEQQTFRLHNLFKEFLQHRAKSELSIEETNIVFQLEAEYYLEKGRIAKGLACYFNGQDYSKMDSILKHEGLKLLAQNRTISIYNLLQKVPKETLEKHGWLTLFTGILQGDFAPQESLPLLESALETLRNDENELGELIALAQIIYYHFVVTGRYNIGTKLLPRTEELFLKNQDSLDVHAKTMILRNLASGYFFFNAETGKAKHYASMASTLAIRHDLKNFMVSTHFILGYIELLTGNLSFFLKEAEICFSLINDPRVSMSNKLTLRVMHLCYLSMIGDSKNFDTQKVALQNKIDLNVIKQTVAAPYLSIWAGILAIRSGDFEQANILLHKGGEISSIAATAHMSSQFLQWDGFVKALTRKKDESIIETMKASHQQRQIAGGPFYMVFNAILYGATLTLLGDYKRALELLKESCEGSQKYSFHYLEACSLFYLGYLYIVTNNATKANSTLSASLRLMNSYGYNHLWGMNPKISMAVFNHCIREKIEPSLATDLSLNQLGMSPNVDGLYIPILEITLLNGFSINYQNQPILEAKDFTQQQRHLLGLLFSANKQQMSLELIYFSLWPDSNTNKARKSFDALLDRLRKLFTPHISDQIKKYIVVEKGILSLQHCRLDTTLMLDHVEAGCSAANNGSWWQASNEFTLALSYWHENIPTEQFQSEKAAELEDKVTLALQRVGSYWGDYLFKNKLYEETINIYEKLWSTSELNEKWVKQLYQSYTTLNSLQKCWSTIDRYKAILSKYEYSKEEIEEYCNEIIRH